MSEMIPPNWNRLKLLDLVETSQAGEWGDEPACDHNDVFVLRSTNFTNSGIIDYSKLVVRNIAEKKRLSKLLKRGDIVLEKSGGSPSQPVGRVVYFDRDGDFLYSNFTQKITPSNVVDSKYFFYKLYFEYQNGLVLKFQQQTTGIINFQLSEYLNLREIFPPKNEQQKIASILTAVDEVIESTTAQINKLKDLKTGMMQELLTKGIGHTEFKDSPVGRIPKAWDCCLLDKVAKRGSGHTPDKQTHEYWNGGVKWISLADSSKLDRLYISQTENNISELGILNSSAVLHPKGTVVMTRDAGIGKSAITTDQMAVSQHFMAWVCGDKLNNHFLYYLLQLWKPRFENIAIGSTIKTIGLQYFKTLEIPVPPISEQEKIASALLSMDNSIFRIEMKRTGFLDLKKALMQDLLTGKVRARAM